MKKYDDVFVAAWTGLLNAWEKEEILLRNEADLRCHLFSECLRLMKERNFEKPYEISVEHALKGRLRPDLTLGYQPISREKGESWTVVVEIKWIGATDKVTKGEVETDMRKLADYSKDNAGVLCYLLLIDETKRYRDELKQEKFALVERRAIKPFNVEKDALLYGYNP